MRIYKEFKVAAFLRVTIFNLLLSLQQLSSEAELKCVEFPLGGLIKRRALHKCLTNVVLRFTMAQSKREFLYTSLALYELEKHWRKRENISFVILTSIPKKIPSLNRI